MNVSSDDAEEQGSPKRSIIEKYSALKISPTDAMSLLNMQCLEDLWALTSAEGLSLPHLDRKDAILSAQKLLQSAQAKEEPFMRSCDLIIMDAGPLIKLALINGLDLLLAFDLHVYIPDEVFFEAVEKFSWEHETEPSPAALLLANWVAEQERMGRVSRPTTLVGESALMKRNSGEYSPSKKNHHRNTGELAAHDFLNNRAKEGQGERPTLLLINDGPAVDKIQLQKHDGHILSTFSMLTALEQKLIISSAEIVWSEIESQITNVLMN